jgi:hypothetical protein
MIDFETLLFVIAFTPLLLIVILIEVVLRLLFKEANQYRKQNEL